MSPTLLVLHGEPAPFTDVIRARFPDLGLVACSEFPELGSVLERARPTVVLAGKSAKYPFPRDLLVNASSVRWIYSISTGVDHLVPWDGTKVAVTHSRGLFSEAIAQYVIAMVLAERLRLRQFAFEQRQKTWSPAMWQPLERQVLLIFGAGQIGSCIARHAKDLGLVVIGVRTQPRSVPEFDRIVTFDALGDAIGTADFVVNCLPGTSQTRGRIDHSVLQQVKPGAYLIDVGRGGVIDHSALMSALESKRLSGAALDVFPVEPLPGDSPLWTLPNVTITPHISGNVSDYRERVAHDFCDRLQAWLSTGELSNVVSPDRGY